MVIKFRMFGVGLAVLVVKRRMLQLVDYWLLDQIKIHSPYLQYRELTYISSATPSKFLWLFYQVDAHHDKSDRPLNKTLASASLATRTYFLIGTTFGQRLPATAFQNDNADQVGKGWSGSTRSTPLGSMVLPQNLWRFVYQSHVGTWCVRALSA